MKKILNWFLWTLVTRYVIIFGGKINVGDLVYPKNGYNNLLCYFWGKPKKVVRVEKTPNLSYCQAFIYVISNGKEQGFYNTALNKVVKEKQNDKN